MERDKWIDGVKFILIVLVIFGHCKHFTLFDGSLQSTKVVSVAIHSVYLFHMPLFVIISGYFSKKSDQKHFRHSIITLLKVFIIFHLLWIGIDFICGKPFKLTNYINPSFTLWYLLSLVYWRIILHYIPSKYDRCAIVLPLTILISLLGGITPLTNEFSIPRTFTFLPLFFLGYYAKKNDWLKGLYHIHPLWFIIPAIALIIFENNIYMDVYGRKPYVEFADVVKRSIYLSSSIVISIAFIKMLPQKISIFAGEGKNVLFYYVYHSFVLFLVAELLNMFGVIVGGWGLIVIVLATLGILYSCRRIELLNILLR